MDDELLSIGQRCVVSGLASRAELNGRGGSIVGYDAQTGRHLVKVDGQEGSSSFSIRAANVIAEPSHCRAARLPLAHSRMAPVTVRRAWRSYLGEFDGDTDDEDEYIADVRAAKRQKAATPAQRRDVVTLHPRGSRDVTVVATADLHRHHEEEYIGGLSLAGWFESDRSPAHVDVCLFAGDVGLEREAESTSRAQTRRDGNHDGLLCRDADCLACARLARHDPAAPRQGGEAPPLHDEGRAAAGRLRRLLSGLPGGRVHVLCDEAAN